MRRQVFQQVVSLGPSCRAKHHIRKAFGHNISKRGAFDWQITPPNTVLDYIRGNFEGTFERRDLEVFDNRLVVNTKFGTEHPHQFPKTGITEADLDRLYPAARAVHERSCQVTRGDIASRLSTLFVLASTVEVEVVHELKALLSLLNPAKRFEILPAPVDDQNTVDDWSGDPELWARHLAPYQVVAPLSVRLEYQFYRLRKNIGYLLPA